MNFATLLVCHKFAHVIKPQLNSLILWRTTLFGVCIFTLTQIFLKSQIIYHSLFLVWIKLKLLFFFFKWQIILGLKDKIIFFSGSFASPTAEEFCAVGGVCARATKLLRVRVFSSPRLCAFSSARPFCAELTLLYSLFLFFSVKLRRLPEKSPGFRGEAPRQKRCALSGVWRGRTAIVRWVSAHALLCCVHQLSRCSSCFAPCALEVLGYLTYFAFSRRRFADSETRVFNWEFLCLLRGIPVLVARTFTVFRGLCVDFVEVLLARKLTS